MPSETPAGPASNAPVCEDYTQYGVSFIGRFGSDDFYVSVAHSDIRHPDRPHPHLVGRLTAEEAARAMFDSIELATNEK